MACSIQVAYSSARKNSGNGNSQIYPKSMSAVHLAASFGLKYAVHRLLEKGFAVDSKDDWGRTPLSVAAENGHLEVVRLLLSRDDVEADSEDKSGRTPLSRAAAEGHED